MGLTPPLWSRHLTLQNLRNINFLVIFSILDGGPRKVNDLLTSQSNQFRDYSIWNRIEKLVPLNWNFAPHTLKTLKNTIKLFSNLDFLQKSGFPKTRICPRQPPGGFIFPEMTPKKKYVSWKLQKHQKSSFFNKMAPFRLPFLGGSILEIWNPQGAAGDKSRVFGNPDFTKKSSLKTGWSVVLKVFN